MSRIEKSQGIKEIAEPPNTTGSLSGRSIQIKTSHIKDLSARDKIAKGFLFFISIVLLFIPIAGWAFLYVIKYKSQTKAKTKVKLQDNIANAVLDQLQKSLHQIDSVLISLESSDLNDSEKQRLKKKLQAIDHMILKRDKKELFLDVSPAYNSLRAVRGFINDIFHDKAFKKLLEADLKHEYVVLTQTLATQIRITPSMAVHFRDLGKEFFSGKEKTFYSLEDVALHLKDAIIENIFINKDNIINKLFFTIISPTKAHSSVKSTGFFEREGRTYNSYETGNLDAVGYAFTAQKDGKSVKMPFHYGPGPQSDYLFDAEMGLRQTFCQDGNRYIGMISPQVNLQKPQGAEGKRSEVLSQFQEEYDGFRLMSFPMDGRAWKMKEEFSLKEGDHTVGAFLNKYKTFAIGKDPEAPDFQKSPSTSKHQGIADNGFYISEKVMPKEEVEEGFETVAKAIGKDLLIEGSKDDRYETGRALQLCVQTFISLRGLYLTAKSNLERKEALTRHLQDRCNEQLKELLEQPSFGQACKQDIDRGVAANILTRLFLIKMNGGAISHDVLLETIGAVIGRAEMVSRRNIQLDRIQPALVALEIAGSSPQFFEKLKAYVEKDTGLTLSVD